MFLCRLQQLVPKIIYLIIESDGNYLDFFFNIAIHCKRTTLWLTEKAGKNYGKISEISPSNKLTTNTDIAMIR